MTVKHCIDPNGKYQSFTGGVLRRAGKETAIEPKIPEGFTEVAGPPPHGSCRWDGQAWGPADPARVALANEKPAREELAELKTRLAALEGARSLAR